MKKGGGGSYTIRRCFLARHKLCFLYRLYTFHLQVMKGILRETVSVPPLNHMNVTAVNKDFLSISAYRLLRFLVLLKTPGGKFFN